MIKNEIIGAILGHEGGYVNDPKDSGGETNWGITKATARQYGYNGAMASLSKNEAIRIYDALFWEPMQLDEIARHSPALAYVLFDLGVNAGVGRASRYLQRCLNVLNNQAQHYADLVVDGDIGAATMRAFKAYYERRGAKGLRIIAGMVKAMQMNHYITLAERREKDEKFVYGWAQRGLSEPSIMEV